MYIVGSDFDGTLNRGGVSEQDRDAIHRFRQAGNRFGLVTGRDYWMYETLTREGIDCRRCLSYLTIEHRGPIPEAMAHSMGRRIYGCDTCQRVCPHNKNAQSTEEISFSMSPDVAALTPEEWHSLTPERYKGLFKHSAIERAGYEGLMRNIKTVLND